MPRSPAPVAPEPAASSRGRKRDETRDSAILDAVIETLADVGYDGMTMDLVAARAKAGKATVYRRWPSKADMVLEAVASMKREQVDLENLPDTGSLRDDLLALFRPRPRLEMEQKLRATSALASLLAQHPALADVGHQALVTPWVDANRILIARSIERGEGNPEADLETLAQIIPSMGAYRALVQRRAFDRPYLMGLIDGLLLPALGIPAPPTATPRRKPKAPRP